MPISARHEQGLTRREGRLVPRDIFQARELFKVGLVDIDVAAGVKRMFVEISRRFIGKKHDPLLAVKYGVKNMRQIGIIMQRGHGALAAEEHKYKSFGEAFRDLGPAYVVLQFRRLPENIERK